MNPMKNYPRENKQIAKDDIDYQLSLIVFIINDQINWEFKFNHL